MVGYPDGPIVYGMDFLDSQVGLVAGAILNGLKGIYRTVDGGRTWTLVYQGLVNDVAFLTSSVAVAAQADRMLRSTDQGQTWTDVTGPVMSGQSGFATATVVVK